jgi:hypothetical protein
VALAILMELNIRLTVLVVETARLERRGVNDKYMLLIFKSVRKISYFLLQAISRKFNICSFSKKKVFK